MKKPLIICLFLTLMLGITGLAWANPVEYTIGTGTAVNTTTGAPTPYGTFFKNFRQQYLYRASDLTGAGASAGNIWALAFNVQTVNNCSPMPNFSIRIKTTAQTALTTTFEVGTYTQVWYQNNFLPVNGWNVHEFMTPFHWNGTDNLLVDIITTLIPGAFTQNASVFFTATTGVNTSLRFQHDTTGADTATTGTTSVNRANIRFAIGTPSTAPNPAALIFPANGSTALDNVTLRWASGGGYPTGYRLYLGTDGGGTVTPTNLVNGLDLNVAFYQHPTLLANMTQYYWQIVPYNGIGSAVGCPIWSFSTPTPMTGTWTIGSAGNFPTFTAAINHLNINGVGTGGVNFHVAAETFAENPPPITITGTAANPIVFQRAPGSPTNPLVTPTGGTGTFGFKLEGVSYVTFDRINVSASNLIYGYWLTAGSTNNTIMNCAITPTYVATTNYGIYSLGAAGLPNSNNTFQGNIISGNPSYGIFVSSVSGAENNNNLIHNNSMNTVRQYGVYVNLSTNTTVSNNVITYNTGGTVGLYGIWTAGTTGSVQVFGNIIDGGSTSGLHYGLYSTGGTNVFHNNQVRNVSTSGTSSNAGIWVSGGTNEFYNNSVHSLTNTSTGILYGAYISTGTHTVRDNEFRNLNGAGSIHGVSIIGGTLVNLYNNYIHNIAYTGSTTHLLHGISLSGSTESNIYNNMVYDLRAPAGTSGAAVPQIRAMNITSGTTGRIYNNTVYINATSSNASFATAALYITPTANAYDIKNNIFANHSTPGATGRTVAFWKTTAGVTNLAGSDKNIYYAGTPSAINLIGFIVSTGYETLDSYKAAVATIDQGSYTEVVPFVSPTAPFNVHIATGTPTRVEGNAIPITTPISINFDINNQPRHATMPDIGADEGNFTPVVGPPGIPILISPANNATGVLHDAQLTWSASAVGGTPTSYNIYFGTTNPPPQVASGWVGTTYSPILNFSQTYYWQIEARNDAGISDPTAVWSFTVMADPMNYTFPWSEGFEGITVANTLPPHWAATRLGTMTLTYLAAQATYNRIPRTGTKFAAFRWGASDWFFTQGQYLEAGQEYEYSFWYITDGMSGWTTLRGTVGTTQTAATHSTIPGMSVSNAINTTYQQMVGYFTPATTGYYYFGVNCVATSVPWYLSMDDFYIREVLAEPPAHVQLLLPADNAQGIDPTAVTLQWTPPTGGGIQEYYMVYVGLDPDNIFDNYSYYYDPVHANSINLSAQPGVNLGYLTRWYWCVLPHNEHGEPDPADPGFMLWSFVTAPDPTIVVYPHLENFDGVTVPSLPYGWSRIVSGTSTQNITTSTTTPVSPPNNVFFTNAADANANLILVSPPQSIPVNTIRTRFWARSGTSGQILQIGTVNAGGVFTQITTQALTTTNALYVINLTAYPGSDIRIGFRHGLGSTSRTIHMDNIEFIELVDNDLAATALTGPGLITQGTASEYTVTVRNEGLVAQSAYTVQLVRETTHAVLASVNITASIAPTQTVQHLIPWTPGFSGPADIYGRVVLAGDQTPANDRTAARSVMILGPTYSVLTLGNPATTTSAITLPVNFWYRNSVSETIHYYDEMRLLSGTITHIMYRNNFTPNRPGMPINIYMQNTSATSVATAWLPSANYQLVFSGPVDFPAGVNEILIPLNQPFVFTGPNLAVRAHRPWDPNYYSGCNFFFTATPAYPGRARHTYSDTVTLDPLTPSGATTETLNQHANTWLVVENAVFAQPAILQGHVYIAGSSPPVPVAGATVTLTQERFSTTTNDQGFYQFTLWSSGTYGATVTRPGYYPASATGLVLTTGTTVIQNFNLVALPQVTVSGIITANDAPLGLEGASVALTGPQNYNTVSGPGGVFSIPNVVGHVNGVNFTLAVTMAGYQTVVTPVTVYETNVNVGTINLIEILWPAYNLVAVETVVPNRAVDLTWEPAGPPPFHFFDFEADSGGWVASATWGTPPVGDWAWTGTYNVNNFVVLEGGASTVPPASAYSGTGLWATRPHTNYSNSGGWSYLRRTFDLTGFGAPVLSVWHHMNGNNTWDYGLIKVNGVTVWGTSANATFMPWQQIIVNLAAYSGNPSVQISFEWYATTVVSYAGWYIDNVYIGPAARLDVNSPSRVHVGYDVYRFTTANEGNPVAWTRLAENIATVTYRDNTWQAASPGDYKWAVVAKYSGGHGSAPVISNELERLLDTVDPVSDLNIEIVAGNTVLSWTAVPGATAYLIYAADEPYAPTWTYLNWTANTIFNLGIPAASAKFYYVKAYTGALPPRVGTATPARNRR